MADITIHRGHKKVLKDANAAGSTITGEGGTGKSAGAQLSVVGSFVNRGTLTLDSGYNKHGLGATLSDSGVLTNSGLLNVGSNAPGGGALLDVMFGGSFSTSGTVIIEGSQVLNHGVTDNTGKIIVGGGSGNFYNSQLAVGATFTDAGMMTNENTISVDAFYRGYSGLGGHFDVTGTLSNAATITVGAFEGSHAAYVPGASAELDVTGLLTNTGTISVGGQQTGFSDGFGFGGLLTITGTLQNQGSITIEGSVRDRYTGGIGATLTDAGIITNSGEITLTNGDAAGRYPHYGLGASLIITKILTNNGDIILGSSSYAYDGRGGGASIDITSTGTLMNEGGLYLLGGMPGSFGAMLTNEGVLTNTGIVLVDSGSAGYYYGLQKNENSTLVNNAAFTNIGSVEIRGGQRGVTNLDGLGGVLVNNGSLLNAGTITAGSGYYYSFGTGSQIINDGILTNSGTVVVQAVGGYPDDENCGTLTDVGVLNNYGTVYVETEFSDYGNITHALLSIAESGTLINSGMISGTGIVLNDGVINAIGTAGYIGLFTRVEQNSLQLINNGHVVIDAGDATLVGATVAASSGSTGTFDLAGTLTLVNPVAANQSVNFEGTSAHLILDNATVFQAILNNFAQGDTIDLAGLIAKSATSTGTTLDVALSGGATLTFTLGAPLDAGLTLKVFKDGHGGTDIGFVRQAASQVGLGPQDFAPRVNLTPAGPLPEARSSYATLQAHGEFGLHWLTVPEAR